MRKFAHAIVEQNETIQDVIGKLEEYTYNKYPNAKFEEADIETHNLPNRLNIKATIWIPFDTRGGTMEELRCKKCNKLLYKYTDEAEIPDGGIKIEIVCSRCKTKNKQLFI